MITESILNILYFPIVFIVSACNFALPLVTLPAELPIGLITLFGYIKWLFPLSAILPLLIIRISLGIFNIGWKLILRIKSFIPTFGS